MVKSVQRFEDSSGAVHTTELEAWKAELALILLGSEVVNPASATALTAHIVGHAEMFERVIQAIRAQGE